MIKMHLPLLLIALLLMGVLFEEVSAQEEGGRFSIRVEANEVVLPVYVLYRNRETKATKEESECWDADMESFRHLKPTEKYIPTHCDQHVIRGLGPADFRVFEDGIEQTIRSVRFEAYPAVQVRDSLGDHTEHSHSPRGKWGSLDRSKLPGLGTNVAFYLYRLAYSPAHSQAGSCHQIKVTVKRRGARVYARSDYCNVQYSPSDPLKSAAFGQQLKQYESSADQPTIPLLMQAKVFRANGGSAWVNVTVEFPAEALALRWGDRRLHGTIGIIGTIYKNEAVAVHFSDFACCDSDFSLLVDDYSERILQILARAATPTRYETQLDLSSGDYKLRVILSDGTKFGRAEIPLSVDKYDENQLALSSVALCKRYLDAARAAKEAAAVNLAPQYVPLVSKGVQFEPAGDIRFQKGDPLIAYFEVYEPLLATDSKTKVQ